MKRCSVFLFCALVIFLSHSLGYTEDNPVSNESIEDNTEQVDVTQSHWDRLDEKISLGTLWYINYGRGEKAGDEYNEAHISRGYLTVKLRPVKWFQPRFTADIHQEEGGDWKVRVKYLYGKFIAPIETAVITEPNIEVGLVHNPWFDFEEHVNLYRMEGQMFIERNGVLNSADVGATVGGLLGRKLPGWYRDTVSDKYPGQYGSFSFGIYNGGGYHAREANSNKVIMGRLSIRPLGLLLPNLQASHFFVHGKGNTAAEPTWRLNNSMLSFEHRLFVLIGQFVVGKGNQKGTQIDDTGEAHPLIGYSGFGELKLPWIRSSLIGRFDHFGWGEAGQREWTYRHLGGYAFHFLPHNFALLGFERVAYSAEGTPTDWQVKLGLQIKLDV